MHEAIKYAFYRDVIMFAAASNDGGNKDIAYPANQHSMVICINATTGLGKSSSFTPSRNIRTKSFAILGELIESAWPCPSARDKKECKSGTSYATPIAVAVAATLLQYVRWQLPETKHAVTTRLRSCDGMKAMLAAMSEERDGYSYVVPWKLLHPSNNNRQAYINERILKILGNL